MAERVQTFPIPEIMRRLAPEPEEIWKIGREAGGWQTWSGMSSDDCCGTIHRHVNLNKYPNLIPEFIKEMPQWNGYEDSWISMFVSDQDETNMGLGWHVDGYEVYGFNLEGETIWEYFNIQEGKIVEVEVGEMDRGIYMPCGITHRVRVTSETRTSISLVRPGKLNGQAVEFVK